MAQAVYSTRFLASLGTPVAGTYVVPAGYRAIVRDIDGWNAAGGASTDFVFVSITGGIGVIFQAQFGALAVVQWRGRQVVNAGEQLEVGGNTESQQSILVSGYLLTLP